MTNYLINAINQQQLPADFSKTIEQWFKPIAADVAARAKNQASTFILGVQGTQGSGKSTLASFLCLLLEQEFQLSAVSLSIDDFYLTAAERQQLAATVHPLLATRGVPGTHDLKLAHSTIHRLCQAGSSDRCAIPRFNKAMDDRFGQEEWDYVNGPVDVIVFEGWCMGVPAQSEQALIEPINELERLEDSNGDWRKFVNNALKNEYANMFELLDALVVLSAPSFDCVYQWRLLQEQKLKAKWHDKNSDKKTKILSPEDVKRFISHYQRLTEQGLSELPDKCDWQLVLAENHDITALKKQELENII